MRSLAILALLWLVVAGPAAALRLDFPTTALRPSGSESRAQVFVTNDSEGTVAVEIRAETRRHELDGSEVNASAGHELAIFPKQLLLPPGGEKLVSVFWKGPEEIDRERAYRIVVEQLPIDPSLTVTPGPGGGPEGVVRVLTRIKKSAYVAPEGVEPELVVESAGPARDADGTPRLELLLHNQGGAHQIVEQLDLRVERVGAAGVAVGAPRRVSVDPDGFDRFNLLAGEKRVVRVDWPAGVPVGAVRVSLD